MASRRGAVTLEGTGFCFVGVVELLPLVLKEVHVDGGVWVNCSDGRKSMVNRVNLSN